MLFISFIIMMMIIIIIQQFIKHDKTARITGVIQGIVVHIVVVQSNLLLYRVDQVYNIQERLACLRSVENDLYM